VTCTLMMTPNWLKYWLRAVMLLSAGGTWSTNNDTLPTDSTCLTPVAQLTLSLHGSLQCQCDNQCRGR